MLIVSPMRLTSFVTAMRAVDGRDAGQVLVVQREVDPLPGDVEGVLADPAQARRPADQRPLAILAGAQLQRVAPCDEVTPVHGDLPAGPHLVLALLRNRSATMTYGSALPPAESLGM